MNNAHDLATISAENFGESLQGMGLNLLVRHVGRTARFLTEVFDIEIPRQHDDFAIAIYAWPGGSQTFMLHQDATYGQHPAQGLLPENPPRGGGVDLRLYNTDPDEAEAKALALQDELGLTILQSAVDKAHGLREVAILDPDGYLWTANRPLSLRRFYS